MGSPPPFDTILGPTGPLARTLGEYEYRPAQIKMAQTVWEAITQSQDALIEAGTGTGKSIAYLVPILLSDRAVIIATANKALQAQLYDKDVPLVRKALDLEFDTVLIKGRQNYVCLRKYRVELPQQRVFAQIDGTQVYDLDALDDWVRSTDTGDLEELPFVLDPETLGNITCPADECLHRECLHYDRCFVMAIRRRAAEAQVIVTNHHLLITDLQLRTIGGVSLPDVDLIVCDEAHQLEDVATSIFETTVTDYTVPRLLLRRLVRQHTPASTLDDLAAQNRLFFEGIRSFMNEPSTRLDGDWQEGIRLGQSVRDLAESLGRLNPYDQDPDMDEENTRFGLALQAIRSAAGDILAVSREKRDDQVVRYAEQVRRRHISLVLHATPISAAKPLGKYLFGENTVVCTSATLSTGGTFDLFRSRCGIEQPPIELIGSPVFAFEEQAILYIPELPPYDWQSREAFFEAVAQETKRLLEVSRGRAFCLFTSWAGMQQVVDKLRPDLPWPVLVQGELPRSELLRQYRDTRHSVLFGTKSFWQGVDMPGDALSLVIIDKLPFPSPRDPLHQARTQRIAEEGGNAFVEYTLPQMILALKQGFGRLIRAKTDRGIVAVLDNRLTTKRYGSLVINSLPPAKVSRRFSDIYHFYSHAPFDADYALTTWVETGDSVCEFRWQLTRLLDGRTKQGVGVAATPQQARWQGTLVGVEQLQSAIIRGGRKADQFRLEIRLPGIVGDATRILHDGQPDLQDRLSMFKAVHAYTLDDGPHP